MIARIKWAAQGQMSQWGCGKLPTSGRKLYRLFSTVDPRARLLREDGKASTSLCGKKRTRGNFDSAFCAAAQRKTLETRVVLRQMRVVQERRFSAA